MTTFNIAVLNGDGIGPEIMTQALKVLNKISVKFNFKLCCTQADIGGIAIDNCGEPLPQNTIEVCKKSDAVLLAAVGGPKWDNLPGNKRPEAGLLGIRKSLGLFANLRRSFSFDSLIDSSPIKRKFLGDKLDIMVVRELTGGMYFGEKGRSVDENGVEYAFDVEKYSEPEITRIARTAFELAMKRNKNLCSVDKANVLESSRFWRECVANVAKSYPQVTLSNMYVDNCSMQLINNPSQFDVILTSNMFGDIITDEASMLCGSIGMIPSASLGDGNFGLYEPVHGSAPDIAGHDTANPIAMILSSAMMLSYSLNQPEACKCIENAVKNVIRLYRTYDIRDNNLKTVSCSEMGTLICSAIEN